jgi:allantoinase
MSAPPDLLRYAKRGPGLDHPWFSHSTVFQRPPLRWPGGKPIALWIAVPIEFFPLDMPLQPLRPIGALDRPSPDLWQYANRDYGNRIGIYRIMRVLDRAGLRASALMNAEVANRMPRLLAEIVARDWEIVASGIDMGHLHHGGLTRDAKDALVARALRLLREASRRPVIGWHSPAHSTSSQTLELLAAHSVEYCADWVNDDLPYVMKTPAGRIVALPLNYEWSDRNVLAAHNLTVGDYETEVLHAFRWLEGEAGRHGGRVLSLSITPWILGYPHRIAALARVLDAIVSSGAVWPATGAEIFSAFKEQLGEGA